MYVRLCCTIYIVSQGVQNVLPHEEFGCILHAKLVFLTRKNYGVPHFYAQHFYVSHLYKLKCAKHIITLTNQTTISHVDI